MNVSFGEQSSSSLTSGLSLASSGRELPGGGNLTRVGDSLQVMLIRRPGLTLSVHGQRRGGEAGGRFRDDDEERERR